MTTGTLKIDEAALTANWRALDRIATSEAGAVVKANGYGLGTKRVASTLARAGARQFFIAVAQEGAALRAALGPEPVINVFSGHMDGDTGAIANLDLTPMLNSPEQFARHSERLPDHPFGLQIDSGMNRLGIEEYDWQASMAQNATLVMSHLACADEPDHPMNTHQLAKFTEMTAGLTAPRSLAATGGTLLGPDFHFDMVRPGIGLYGGLPFKDAQNVVTVDLPVVQTRRIPAGESIGYGNAHIAVNDMIVATVSGGYADGLIRAMSAKATLFTRDVPCPLIGRVSMDLLTIDVTHLDHVPDVLTILGPHQTVDQLANAADTIGYEILTSLGGRYSVEMT
ncbi:MAG: alanine racemase [Litoreibacter sp.]